MARVTQGDIYVNNAGDRMTGNLVLANDVQLRGQLTSGAEALLATIGSDDITRIGSGAANTYIYSASETYEYVSGAAYPLWTQRNLQHKIKTSDEVVINSSVLQNDDHLYHVVPPNYRVRLELLIRFYTSVNALFKMAFTLPTGATGGGYYIRYSNTVTSWPDITVPTTVSVGNTMMWLSVSALISMGTTGGTIQFQWTQNSSDGSPTTVYAGSSSYLIWE